MSLTESPAGIAFLTTLAGGIGFIGREIARMIRNAPERRYNTITELGQEVDRLRDRLGKLENDLRKVNIRYFSLANKHLALNSKHTAVVSVIKYEGSPETKAKVDRVLSVYGESLDAFDQDANMEPLEHPVFTLDDVENKDSGDE